MRKTLAAWPLLAVIGTSAQAADLFNVRYVDGSATAVRSYSDADAVFNGTSTAFIQQALPGYVSSDALQVSVDYLGLPAQVSFAAGSRTAVLTLPTMGITRSFTGLNRDDSVVQLQQYFRNGLDLGRLYGQLLRTNPVDPTTRLLGQQVEAGFDDTYGGFGFIDEPDATVRTTATGQVAQAGDTGTGTGTSSGSGNQVGVGLTFSGTTYGGLRQYMTSVPLTYKVRNSLEPRRQLVLGLNLTHYTVNGASAWSVSPGLAYAMPMSATWTLTPSLQYGYTQSSDMATRGSVLTAALCSAWLLYSDGSHAVVMGNMIGRAESLGLKQGGTTVDPGLGTTALRNGIMASQPLTLLGRRMAVEASIVNTTFVGTPLYTQRFNELALTLGTNRNGRTTQDYLRAGIKYQFSSTSHGVTAQVGYWF